ncbi:unnamed protein product, partial [Didymodactylos carnosus]
SAVSTVGVIGDQSAKRTRKNESSITTNKDYLVVSWIDSQEIEAVPTVNLRNFRGKINMFQEYVFDMNRTRRKGKIVLESQSSDNGSSHVEEAALTKPHSQQPPELVVPPESIDHEVSTRELSFKTHCQQSLSPRITNQMCSPSASALSKPIVTAATQDTAHRGTVICDYKTSSVIIEDVPSHVNSNNLYDLFVEMGGIQIG